MDEIYNKINAPFIPTKSIWCLDLAYISKCEELTRNRTCQSVNLKQIEIENHSHDIQERVFILLWLEIAQATQMTLT